MNEEKKIALLYGGISSEREISLKSGKNVGESLIKQGYSVEFVDTKTELNKLIDTKFDVAFNCLHGKGGEDGTIQGFLETIDLPYTGSKVLASARAISKADTKVIYDNANISNAKYFVVNNNEEFNLDTSLEITGDDVVVKASTEGSSIGLYFASGIEEIKIAIDKAFEFDNVVVVEKRIPGREFTVAVLEFPKDVQEKLSNNLNFEGSAAALPVIEIIPKNEYYDFSSKYDEGGSKHECPAKIDKSLADKLQKAAVKAHKVLGCSGFSRTDFRVDENNNLYALETNTIPGMTQVSLVPDAARSVGISFDELCSLILNYAIV